MSSRSSCWRLKKLNSSITPRGPPSWLAPLSETSMSSVLSSRPCCSRNSTRRPICASVWSRKRGERLLQARGERALGCRRDRPTAARRGCAARASCPRGTMPISSWRANQRSRATSQPSSKRPRYFVAVLAAATGAARASRRTRGRGRTAGRGAPTCRSRIQSDRLVDEVFAERGSRPRGGAGGSMWWLSARELGVELVGLALQEAVEAVEALLQRPVRRAGRRRSTRASARGATCRRRTVA